MGYMCDDHRDRDRDYTSKAQGNLNTVLSIIGAAGAVGGENGGLPFLNGGGNKMAELRAENAELKAEKYAENTAQALYNRTVADNKELSGFLCDLKTKVATLEGKMDTQKVENDNAILRERLATLEQIHALEMRLGRRLDACETSIPLVQERCMGAVDRERERRECADNAIVNYSNGMFLPVQVADVTVGTTSTARVPYNPLPCECRKAA